MRVALVGAAVAALGALLAGVLLPDPPAPRLDPVSALALPYVVYPDDVNGPPFLCVDTSAGERCEAGTFLVTADGDTAYLCTFGDAGPTWCEHIGDRD